MIGSVWWRFLNYGAKPTFRYLFERSGRYAASGSLDFECDLGFFLKKSFGSDMAAEVSFARSGVESLLTELRNTHERDFNKKQPIKPVLEANSSTSRLIVLTAILSIVDIDTFIETGTQHGVSASCVSHLKQSKQMDFSIHSFDVGPTNLIRRESDVAYVNLKSPTRRNFKRMTLKIDTRNAMFFHDSDHTFENMFFEFDWAWNVLKVNVLVADDIDMNSAFSKFCQKNSLEQCRIKVDSGTTIGVVVRNHRP